MSEQSADQKLEGIEADLLLILRKIVDIRKQLYKAAIVGLIIGIIVGLSIPKQYTVDVTLSPEVGGDKGNGGISSLAASFLGGGASMSNGTDALNASLSSEIVSSTPFLLELLDMQIVVDNSGEIKTLSDYLMTESSPWWNSVVGFPNLVIDGVRGLFTSKVEYLDLNKKLQNGIISLTQKENAQIGVLKKIITANINKKTAITNVRVTLQNPRVAAIVADSVVHRLQEYIIDYRTSKAKEDCVYLEHLFEERKQEYYDAQKKYARYVDTHDNLILQSVRTEQERLQNDMALSYQIYSQVANQLQVARAKVQEEKPVFAVVEPAVIPLYPSGLGIKVYALLYLFMSVFCTLGWIFAVRKVVCILKK